MKTGNILVLVGGGAFALWLLNKARAAANLNFYPGNLQGISFVNGVPVGTFTVAVQNTSNADVPINSMAGNVFDNGNLVGNVSQFSPFVVPGNAQVLIPVQVQFRFLGVINDIITAFQNGLGTHKLNIDGTVNVGGYQQPVNLNYTVGS